MHGHGAAVVVNVVAALALAKTWILWMKQAGFGVAGGSGLVASVFLTLKAILIDSGSMNEVPLVRGMRQTLEARLGGGAAACEVLLPEQREVLGLRGVVHVVGGPHVLHGRVLAALLRPEERVLQHPARAAGQAVGCAACKSHGQPAAAPTAAVVAIAPATSPAVGARPSARPPQARRLRPRPPLPPLQPLLPSPLWPVLRHAPPPARADPPRPGGALRRWVGL